ncbi:MAG: diaminopimelate epimerase [Pseudomonadota bacterium]
MRIQFTKMQGAGNDFVVLDETQNRLDLTLAQYRFLADRHFGVGADQILSVRPPPPSVSGIDFSYAIHNADGEEVEHCGNGARCFFRFVRDRGLISRPEVRVQTMNRTLALVEQADGSVTVDMGAPVFDLAAIPFDASGVTPQPQGDWETWPLEFSGNGSASSRLQIATLSMGNPHAVTLVADVDTAPVLVAGPLVERHARFPRRVNAGFMQIMSRGVVKLRVFERGAGETLACGSGACAAVVAGIRLGLLDERVAVHTHGGVLTIEWQGRTGGLSAPVRMSGPATWVFDGEIDIPD